MQKQPKKKPLDYLQQEKKNLYRLNNLNDISQIHPVLSLIARATKGTPFEKKIWTVGGTPRDYLLGKKSRGDVDLVIEKKGLELAQFFYENKLTSIAPVIYPRFGTALIKIKSTNIEIVTARKEIYDKKSRNPQVTPATLEDDAARRDFTMNSLFLNLHNLNFYDPLGCGLDDLKNKILRTPKNPLLTFDEDPLRMLRAVRFRWKLGFKPTNDLEKSIIERSYRLKIISAERIRDEISKILVHPRAEHALNELLDKRLLFQFAPELCSMKGVAQGDYHHLDVWDHSLLTLKNARTSNLMLAWSCLLHDIGKPKTKHIDSEGKIRFFGHEMEGANITKSILTRLKYSNAFIEKVELLVKNHRRLGSEPNLSDTALKRILCHLSNLTYPLLQLTQADINAHKPGAIEYNHTILKIRIKELKRKFSQKDYKSPLSGEEIMNKFSLKPGPLIGQAKKYLVNQVLEGKLNCKNKSEAEELLKIYLQKMSRE